MNIYLRKILKHDITHQISVTKEILNGFFNVYEEKASTKVTGKKSGFTGTVTFLLYNYKRALSRGNCKRYIK